jgi:hypothetical protein
MFREFERLVMCMGAGWAVSAIANAALAIDIEYSH